MLTLRNTFYQNPEANARLLLQQQMMYDAQRNVERILLEMWALKSLASHGQFCFCIPVGVPPPPLLPPPYGYPVYPEALQQPARDASPCRVDTCDTTTKLRVSVASERHKAILPSKSDACEYRIDEVEIILDLRAVLPAEISVRVEERRIRVEANRVDGNGVQNYWRQYELPACVSCELARCILSHDGFLHITAPWYKME